MTRTPDFRIELFGDDGTSVSITEFNVFVHDGRGGMGTITHEQLVKILTAEFQPAIEKIVKVLED